MIKRILEKWFNLEPPSCNSCDLLRSLLEESTRERKELIARLLEKGQVEPLVQTSPEEFKPIGNQFIPWRVRQQMLEAEDRKQFQLMRDKEREISNLEKEMGLDQVEEFTKTGLEGAGK